jgi:hypothetical protein
MKRKWAFFWKNNFIDEMENDLKAWNFQNSMKINIIFYFLMNIIYYFDTTIIMNYYNYENSSLKNLVNEYRTINIYKILKYKLNEIYDETHQITHIQITLFELRYFFSNEIKQIFTMHHQFFSNWVKILVNVHVIQRYNKDYFTHLRKRTSISKISEKFTDHKKTFLILHFQQ